MVTVSNNIEAEMIEALLNSLKIPVLKKYREAGDYLKVYMGGTNFGVDLYVPSKLLENAKDCILGMQESNFDKELQVTEAEPLDILDLLISRRSIRKFENRDVEQVKIDSILKAALLSPSSKARRPWEFIAVTDKEVLKQLSLCREQGSQFLSGAPMGIVVIADSDACDVWIEDVSIASIIIQLTAQALGLGSCWIQVRERYHSKAEKAETYIKEALGIPAKYNVECIIAIGYPGEDKEPNNVADLSYHKIHYNQYGGRGL